MNRYLLPLDHMSVTVCALSYCEITLHFRKSNNFLLIEFLSLITVLPESISKTKGDNVEFPTFSSAKVMTNATMTNEKRTLSFIWLLVVPVILHDVCERNFWRYSVVYGVNCKECSCIRTLVPLLVLG